MYVPAQAPRVPEKKDLAREQRLGYEQNHKGGKLAYCDETPKRHAVLGPLSRSASGKDVGDYFTLFLHQSNSVMDATARAMSPHFIAERPVACQLQGDLSCRQDALSCDRMFSMRDEGVF